MKHISAIVGNCKKEEVELKRAWWPRLSTSGEWIRPLEQYYEVVQTWAPVLSKDGEIQNVRIMTKYEYVVEQFTQKN